MFAPCHLNQESQNCVRKIYERLRLSPFYKNPIFKIELNAAQLLSTGCISIIISHNGRTINMFMFCPDAKGKIGSIAIYGDGLKTLYKSISISRNLFGLPVSDIDMDCGYEEFIDVEIGQY